MYKAMRSTQVRRGARWLALAVLMVCCALFGARQLRSTAQADAPEPFLAPGSVAVASDRPVCSLLGAAASQTNIVGQDGGASVRAGNTVYWTFNDTWVRGSDGLNRLIPNNLAWGKDLYASNCVNVTHLATNGWARPLLGREPVLGAVYGLEAGIFLSSMMAVQPGYVHFFYVSAEIDPIQGYRLRGIGLGKFDTATLTAERLLGGQFLWDPQHPSSFRVTDVVGFVHDAYVYVLVQVQLADSQMGTLLGRITADQLESSSYQFWNGSAWVDSLPDVSVPAVANAALLWTQPIGTNTPSVSYNPFLGKWLAVYTGGFAERVDARVADNITGPWHELNATTVIDCMHFLPSPQHGFICYLAQQHPEYMTDGGRTIYVTYSNQDAYQVYLHELRLAAPVTQWTDGQGRAVYVTGTNAAPSGLAAQGITFYASDIAVPGMDAIHRWDGTDGTIRYGASSPGQLYQDMGTAFYAPATAAAARATNAPYAPVIRWTKHGVDRYSPLDLAGAGYTGNEIAFFAACPDTDGDGRNDCVESFPPCPDFTGDRVVNIADLTYVIAHYRQPSPRGGIILIWDLADAIAHFRQACPN